MNSLVEYNKSLQILFPVVAVCIVLSSLFIMRTSNVSIAFSVKSTDIMIGLVLLVEIGVEILCCHDDPFEVPLSTRIYL